MKTDKEITTVVFRTWKSPGSEVFALLPLDPYSPSGWECMAYAHIGGHGGACPHVCAGGKSRLATPTEYRPLASELRRIGYRLKIVKKIPRNAYAVRKSKLRICA